MTLPLCGEALRGGRQPPTPLHPTPRGWAGPNFLPMLVFEKYGRHEPSKRQAERYAREGVEPSLSTLADQVGAVAAALAPPHALIEAHVMAAERLHGDDTTVPLLAKGNTVTAGLWTYVRDVLEVVGVSRRNRPVGGFERTDAGGGPLAAPRRRPRCSVLARAARRASPTVSRPLERDPEGRRLIPTPAERDSRGGFP